jgi:hypothetical protein
MPEAFSTNTIPTTFLIASNGKIVSKEVGMAKYDSESFLDFLLKTSNE